MPWRLLRKGRIPLRFALVPTAALVALTPLAPAATISSLFNTGVDATGTPLADDAPDSHWALVAPGAQVGAPLVVTAANGFPVPPWIGDNTTSAWIGTLSTSALGPTNVTREYHYQTTFDLTGFVPSTAIISGQASQDNVLLDVLINGVSAGISESAVSFGGFSPFSFDAGDIAQLNGGLNTLTFIVQSATVNGTEDYTSVRVEFLSREATLIPEPATAGFLGLAALTLLRRRRRRLQAV
ncbi:MAG: PEP-CTERM sorting domain-containing protein [Verrucomicrobiales bacterium]